MKRSKGRIVARSTIKPITMREYITQKTKVNATAVVNDASKSNANNNDNVAERSSTIKHTKIFEGVNGNKVFYTYLISFF